jgi:hypothetical protein
MYLVPGTISLVTVSGPSKLSNTANVLKCYQFVCPYSITLTKYAVRVETGVASTTGNIGVYSEDGNTKLIDFNFSTASSSTNLTGTFSSVSLVGGTAYWLVGASGSTSVTVSDIGVSLGGSAIVGLINGNSSKNGTAANTLSGGVLPATLGTISSYSGNPDGRVPYVVFE